MLTLAHIEEVLQKTLASIEQQRAQAAAAAEADKHQYAGALEGARFFGHLLAEKVKELENAIVSTVVDTVAEPATATATSDDLEVTDAAAGSPQTQSTPALGTDVPHADANPNPAG